MEKTAIKCELCGCGCINDLKLFSLKTILKRKIRLSDGSYNKINDDFVTDFIVKCFNNCIKYVNNYPLNEIPICKDYADMIDEYQ